MFLFLIWKMWLFAPNSFLSQDQKFQSVLQRRSCPPIWTMATTRSDWLLFCFLFIPCKRKKKRQLISGWTRYLYWPFVFRDCSLLASLHVFLLLSQKFVDMNAFNPFPFKTKVNRFFLLFMCYNNQSNRGIDCSCLQSCVQSMETFVIRMFSSMEIK